MKLVARIFLLKIQKNKKIKTIDFSSGHLSFSFYSGSMNINRAFAINRAFEIRNDRDVYSYDDNFLPENVNNSFYLYMHIRTKNKGLINIAKHKPGHLSLSDYAIFIKNEEMLEKSLILNNITAEVDGIFPYPKLENGLLVSNPSGIALKLYFNRLEKQKS